MSPSGRQLRLERPQTGQGSVIRNRFVRRNYLPRQLFIKNKCVGRSRYAELAVQHRRNLGLQSSI